MFRINSLLKFTMIVIFLLFSLMFPTFLLAEVIITEDVEQASSGTTYVGKTGDGQISITEGSSAIRNKVYVGYEAGSTGVVAVSGTNSELTTYEFYVGYRGNGALTVAEEGSVVSGFSGIGTISGSSGTVTINGMNSIWTNNGLKINNGTLAITNGGQVNSIENNSNYSSIGSGLNSTGIVTVEGANSAWNSEQSLYIGISGNGTLNIIDGGRVTVNKDTWVCKYGSLGSIHFDNGTLRTSGFIANFDKLTGTGNVYTNGLVSDVDIIFDSTHGLSRILSVNQNANQNITIHLDIDGTGSMGVGHIGNGSMRIIDGQIVASTNGYIGTNPGSTGVVAVDGTGSTWTNSSELVVGLDGNGTLAITNGGIVNSVSGVIASGLPSSGTVVVNGVGSKWNVEADLSVGVFDVGVLDIANGGLVTTENAFIGTGSLVNIDVSNNDMFQVGTDLTNDGTVRLSAQAGLAVGTYTPISVGGSWLGSGTYEAFGGVWDEVNHQFLVGAADSVAAGQQADIDLMTQQRVDVGNALCLNFAPSAASNPLSVMATRTSGQPLAALQALLGTDEEIEGSYDFTVTGFPGGDSVMLSFAVTGDWDSDELTIWHYDGTWTEYSADDLTFADGWASFTVDSFSSYAVTAVPEPMTLSLIGVGALALLRRRRKLL